MAPDWSHFGLAAIPPLLAMVVQACNPVSHRVLKKSAEHDMAIFKDGHDYETLVETTAKSAEGAVDISGLAPSVVSAVSSGFSVVHDLPSPFWPAVCYVLPFIAVALLTLRLLGGCSYLEIKSESLILTVQGKANPDKEDKIRGSCDSDLWCEYQSISCRRIGLHILPS